MFNFIKTSYLVNLYDNSEFTEEPDKFSPHMQLKIYP